MPDSIDDSPVVILAITLGQHLDNTRQPCRNGGRSVPLAHLDHDCCDRCDAVAECLRMVVT